MDSGLPAGIELYLRELGITARISYGKELVAACPFHSPDKHPSWSINLSSGLYHCFSCGASGNLAHLISHIKNIPYPLAVIEANNKIGWARAGKWREDHEVKNLAPKTFEVSEADLAMFSSVPQEILAGRRIDPGLASKFGVKYNHENNSWILPIRDPYSHELWGWQEKYIDTRRFRNYPSGIAKSKTLFGISAFEHGSTAVLVESPIDAVRVSAFGSGSGLACSGLQVSDFQLSLVFDLARHVVLALDNDSPGIRETARIVRDYKGRSNFWVFDYGMSKAKDPGEMTDEEIKLGFSDMKSGLRWLTEYDKEHRCGV